MSQNPWAKVNRKHLTVVKSNGGERAIKDAVLKLHDETLLAKTGGTDMTAKEVKYHHPCR